MSQANNTQPKALIARFFPSENLAWLLLFLFSLPAFEFALGKTVDANIRLVQNLNFATNFPALFTTHLPQGPLAFLQYPLPLGNNLSIALFYYALIKIGLLLFLKRYAAKPLEAMLLFAAIYLLIAPRLLPLALLMMLLFKGELNPIFGRTNLAALLLVLILLNTRLSIGILALSLWTLTLAFANFYEGFSFKKMWLLLLLLLVALALFLTPYFYFASAEEVLLRFWSILNVNSSYGLAGLTGGLFSSLALLLVLAFLLFGTISLGPLKSLALKPHQKAQAFIIVLYALLYFRSRPEVGTYYVVVNLILIFFFALQLVYGSPLWKSMAVWLAAALLVGEAFLSQGSFKTTEVRLGAFFSQLVKPQAYRESFSKVLFSEKSVLPPNCTYTVLSGNFKDYLFSDSRFLTSPSYIPKLSESPVLDSLNALFFAKPSAPMYLLSQDAQEGVFASLPQSRAAFQGHYRFLRQEGGIFIFTKID